MPDQDSSNSIDDVTKALQIARVLAAHGIPIFIAPAQPDTKIGFALPRKWQTTIPNPNIVDRWRPGDALCAVTGHGIDVIDIDPRSGGHRANLPPLHTPILGEVSTPSGGQHLYTPSLGVHKKVGALQGIDIQAGHKGSGHGFVFLPPTERISKATGDLTPYIWQTDFTFIETPEDHKTATVQALGLSAPQTAENIPGNIPPKFRAFLENQAPQSDVAANHAIKTILTKLLEQPAQIGTGYRDALNAAAYALGGYVGAGHIDEDEARNKLLTVVTHHWGTPDQDDIQWIEDGLRDGAARPFTVYAIRDGNIAPDQPKPEFSIYDHIGIEPFDPHHDTSDQGLAEAVLIRTRPILRYAIDAGTWLIRGHQHWDEQHHDLGGWAISELSNLMPPGITPIPSKPEDRTLEHWQAERRRFFRSSSGAGKIKSKIGDLIANIGPVSCRITDLDKEAEILWAGGVAWDLRASRTQLVAADIDPATPHLHSALCTPAFVPTPYWDKYIQTVWPDEGIRAWALRVMSIAFTGYADAALPVLYGPERTGKSSFVSLLVDLLGTYAHAADPRLLSGAENAHASVIYALKGKRLSFIDEGPRKGHLATERLKQLTGGAALTGNAMRTNPVTFHPTHTLVMTSNDEPQITDPALRARIRALPCDADKKAVKMARESLTPDIWRVEAPGVLAFMIQEAAAWLAERYTGSNEAAPLELRMAMDEIAAEQDPTRHWLEDCTVPDDVGTKSRKLYEAFCEWHNGHPLHRRFTPPTDTRWGRTLTDAGFDKIHRRDGKYRPLRLRAGDGFRPVTPVTDDFKAGLSTGNPEVKVETHTNIGTNVTGSLPVGDWFFDQPVTPENTSSDPILDTVVTSVTSLSRSISYKNENTHIEIYRENKPKGVTGHTGHKTPQKQGLNSGNKGVTRSEQPVTQQDALLDLLPVKKSNLSTEEKRQQAIQKASGEHIGLPAAWARGQEPRSITLMESEVILQSALTRSGYLAVDVETTGYPVGHPYYQLRTVQLGDVHEAVVLDADTAQDVIRHFLDVAPELVAHSATADMTPLAHADLADFDVLMRKATDTAILALLSDPVMAGENPGLKDVAPLLLHDKSVVHEADNARAELFKAGKWLTNVRQETPVVKSGWAQVDPGCMTMIRYAAADVLDCAALKLILHQVDPVVQERERLVAAITARVTHQGLNLDRQQVMQHINDKEPVVAELLHKIQAQGVINPSSPAQVLDALNEKSLNPVISSAVDVLEDLAMYASEQDVRILAEDVLAYRHETKLITGFLKPWKTIAEQGDGRLRPTIYTLGTNTGRMSCTRPNLQQVPRKGGMRECISAREKHQFIAADFNAVEVRVAAALSGDRVLKQILAEGKDLHLIVAQRIWGDQITKHSEERTLVKRGVFGRLYGAGSKKIASTLGIEIDVANQVIRMLDELTPELIAWTKELKDSVQNGYTQYPSYSGRIIHLPRDFPHKSPNYVIQGTARELLADALLDWEKGPYAGGLVLPIHDEIMAEVPDNVAYEALHFLQQTMTRDLCGVAITAEAWENPQTHWSK